MKKTNIILITLIIIILISGCNNKQSNINYHENEISDFYNGFNSTNESNNSPGFIFREEDAPNGKIFFPSLSNKYVCDIEIVDDKINKSICINYNKIKYCTNNNCTTINGSFYQKGLIEEIIWW